MTQLHKQSLGYRLGMSGNERDEIFKWLGRGANDNTLWVLSYKASPSMEVMCTHRLEGGREGGGTVGMGMQ